MSEQTKQNDLYSNTVTILDKYECLSLGATTIGNLIDEKRIVCKKVKTAVKNKGKKPDVLIVDNSKKIIAYIECKKPEEFNTEKKIEAAINQEIEVAKELGVKIFVATDGTKFVWVNALTKNKIMDEDENYIISPIHPKIEERKTAKLIERLNLDLSDTNDQLYEIKYSDPTNLAKKIGGLLKNIKFTTPKDSLYTFVELFLFKYLSDINILGVTENFDYIWNLYNEDGRSEAEVLYRYIHEPREKIGKLFPEAPDKTSIINGFVFHAEKDSDGNYISNNADATTFHEVMKLFKEYEETDGKFIDINRDFKSKLFETFTKQEKTKENAGKYFTPLKIVKGMVDMVDIKEGDEICDPACGVGKFLLEASLKIDEPFTFENGHVVKKIKLYGFEKEMDEKGSTSGYDLTTILAKANTMIYFSSLFKDNNNLANIKTISQELLNETYFSSKTILGTLEQTNGKQYNVILANPPYYQSALISKTAKDTGFYTEKGMGVEGLFLEWIIKSLKPNGIANVVLPDGIFTNVGNKRLHEFITTNCYVEAIISLPINTFFNTPKKTYIITLRKKSNIIEKQNYPVFAYYCASIGETLDVYRFDIEDNDFQTAVNKYNLFRSCKDKNKIDDYLKPIFDDDLKLKLLPIDSFKEHSAWDIDKRWSDEEKVKMGVKKEDIIMNIDEFNDYLSSVIADINNYGEAIKCLKS
ncbi:HsdM family class I SAM-dependent methyltransferase [Dielma fastidiosa]|uniref:HsdM family class I SAM-dependent methyltransferase n=1 Tax=Dielma fastidiosa TaxID=1034346 RepID=UPI000E4EC5B7|nr:N-6 DNA methylase [Dielma fastidiosa]RHN00130.1 SAM-dependent DNA methyltransferase [Dielma fastidiosa]